MDRARVGRCLLALVHAVVAQHLRHAQPIVGKVLRAPGALRAHSIGEGLALRVDSRTLAGFTTTLGGKASYAHSADWGVLLPYVELEWVQEHGDDAEAFRGFFLDDPTGTPIRVLGDDLDSQYFRAGLGLSMVLGQGRSGFISYERLVARSGISNQVLTLGLRWEF